VNSVQGITRTQNRISLHGSVAEILVVQMVLCLVAMMVPQLHNNSENGYGMSLWKITGVIQMFQLVLTGIIVQVKQVIMMMTIYVEPEFAIVVQQVPME